MTQKLLHILELPNLILILNTAGPLWTCPAVRSVNLRGTNQNLDSTGSWIIKNIPIHQRVAMLKLEPYEVKGKQSNLNDVDSCINCCYSFV